MRTSSTQYRDIQAQRVGFEPTCPKGQTVFKTAALRPLRYLCSFFVPSNKMNDIKIANFRFS